MTHFVSSHMASNHFGPSHYGGIVIVVPIVPGGGLDESPLRMRRFKAQTKKNIRHLLLLSGMAILVDEALYERREDDETDPSD